MHFKRKCVMNDFGYDGDFEFEDEFEGDFESDDYEGFQDLPDNRDWEEDWDEEWDDWDDELDDGRTTCDFCGAPVGRYGYDDGYLTLCEDCRDQMYGD